MTTFRRILSKRIMRAMARLRVAVAPGRPQAPRAPVATIDKPALPVFDRGIYDEFVAEIGEDGTQASIEIFVSDTARRVARLRLLSCPEDRAAIRLEAHTLKGAAGTFGFAQLCQLARSLEAGTLAFTQVDYDAALDELERVFDMSRAAVPPRRPAAAA